MKNLFSSSLLSFFCVLPILALEASSALACEPPAGSRYGLERGCVASIAAQSGLRVCSRDGQGAERTGVSSYDEREIGQVSLLLETQEKRYYMMAPCDICGDLWECDKGTGKATNTVHSHGVDCSDLPHVKGEDIRFKDCRE
jgi:hypothetical protein